jgi:Zn-dependent protease with chaperone function
MSDVNTMSSLSAVAMEKLFEKSIQDSRKFLAFSLLWIAAFIALYFITANDQFKQAVVRAFLYATGFWFLMNFLKQLVVYRLMSVRLSDVKDARLGNFDVSEVREMVNEVLHSTATHERPEVYIMKIDAVNAMAVNVYLFNFIRMANALYVGDKSFSCLSKGELKAMLHHEMAHFNKYMYTESNMLGLNLFYFLVLPFSFIIFFHGFWIKAIFVVGLVVALLYIFMKVRKAQNYDNHILEYLCDLTAAKHTGNLTTINMLIEVARQNVVEEEEKRKEILKRILVPVNRTLVDWSLFDTHLVNGKIEKEEYDLLIENLLNNQHPQLFEHTAVDHNSRSHPSLTNRVLFLHRNAQSH